jgi:chromosome segregation ATPase
VSDTAAELRAACERLREYRERADEREGLDEVADAYEAVERVLDRWEERATDWDDFEGYVEFRNDISETLASIPEDVPESEAFVEADRHVKTKGVSKSLDEGDFEAAREALSPAAEYAELRAELEAAETRHRKARQRARNRRRELDERIDDLERLVELGEADLDAPVEELREPIERYNEAVRSDFAAFRRDAPAAEERLEHVVDVRLACGPLADVDRQQWAFEVAHDRGWDRSGHNRGGGIRPSAPVSRRGSQYVYIRVVLLRTRVT